MENKKMLGKFFICEAPKKGNYVKTINTIREYEDGKRFPIDEVIIADKEINIKAISKEDMGGLNVSNYKSVPRVIDDKLALDLYKMSDLPWKSYIQVLV